MAVENDSGEYLKFYNSSDDVVNISASYSAIDITQADFTSVISTF